MIVGPRPPAPLRPRSWLVVVEADGWCARTDPHYTALRVLEVTVVCDLSPYLVLQVPT